MPDHSHQNPRSRNAFDDPMWNDPAPEQVPAGFTVAPEDYRATVFPYRGSETHGVVPLTPMRRMDDPYAEGAIVHVDPMPPTPVPEPVPVRIVDTSPDDYKDWRTWGGFASDTTRMIANKKEGRTVLRIQNISLTDSMFIGADSTVTAYTGFRVLPGASFSLDCEAPVWAITGTPGVNVPFCAYMEFSSPIT